MALVGGVSFVITFLVVLDGTTDGSPFAYGFFPGAVALVTSMFLTPRSLVLSRLRRGLM